MRPRTLDEVVGQQHLLKPGSPLRRLVGESGGGPAGPSSVILWGPPGTGKTTLAYVVSKATDKRFVELSAITMRRQGGPRGHRGRPPRHRRVRQGDRSLPRRDPPLQQGPTGLPAPGRREPLGHPDRGDHGEPVLLGDLPLLSRSLLLTLEPLTDDDLRGLLRRALTDERGLKSAVTLPEDTEAHLLRIMRRRRPPRPDRPGGRGRRRPRQGGGGDRAPDAGGDRRSRRREVRPRRRPALRRGQRPHQVHPGLRRRRRAALPGPDDRGR